MSILPKMLANHFYTTLVSRNYGFVDEALQHKIKACRLNFFGCGLASMIAESAVRMGFEHIILVDHDTVELSNLNRQNYTVNDIDEAKVIALRERLMRINPHLQCHVAHERIKSKITMHSLIDKADIIINTIDYGEDYFEVVEYARVKHKLVVCPFNPCDSGLAVFFNHESQSIYEFLQTEEVLTGVEFPKRLRELYIPSQLPEKMLQTLQRLLPKIKEKGYFPQFIMGAHLTTAIVLQYIIKYLAQEKIPLAPSLIYTEV